MPSYCRWILPITQKKIFTKKTTNEIAKWKIIKLAKVQEDTNLNHIIIFKILPAHSIIHDS